MGDVFPWRQYLLNRQYPEDITEIWIESKALAASHKRAMSRPHYAIESFKDILPKLGDKK